MAAGARARARMKHGLDLCQPAKTRGPDCSTGVSTTKFPAQHSSIRVSCQVSFHCALSRRSPPIGRSTTCRVGELLHHFRPAVCLPLRSSSSSSPPLAPVLVLALQRLVALMGLSPRLPSSTKPARTAAASSSGETGDNTVIIAVAGILFLPVLRYYGI